MRRSTLQRAIRSKRFCSAAGLRQSRYFVRPEERWAPRMGRLHPLRQFFLQQTALIRFFLLQFVNACYIGIRLWVVNITEWRGVRAGLRSTIGNRVYVNSVPGVRISPSPPDFKGLLKNSNPFFFWRAISLRDSICDRFENCSPCPRSFLYLLFLATSQTALLCASGSIPNATPALKTDASYSTSSRRQAPSHPDCHRESLPHKKGRPSRTATGREVVMKQCA